MKDDYEPIVVQTPDYFDNIEVYVLSDLHMGSKEFDESMWERAKAEILAQPNRFCVFIGDLMENAIPGSKSDVFSQVATPMQQREWVLKQFQDLSDRILAITDGNHERNRSYRAAGMFPNFDAAVIAGIQDRYRPHFAVVDIGVGTREKDKKQQVHYVLYCVHRGKDGKGVNTALGTSGIDAVCVGHTHAPLSIPKAQISYNPINKVVSVRTVHLVNSGAWCKYGGYAVDNGYLPNSDQKHKLVLYGGKKKVDVVGFTL